MTLRVEALGRPPGRASGGRPRAARRTQRPLVCRHLFQASRRGFPATEQLRPDYPSPFRHIAMASLSDRAEKAAMFVADTPFVGAAQPIKAELARHPGAALAPPRGSAHQRRPSRRSACRWLGAGFAVLAPASVAPFAGHSCDRLDFFLHIPLDGATRRPSPHPEPRKSPGAAMLLARSLTPC